MCRTKSYTLLTLLLGIIIPSTFAYAQPKAIDQASEQDYFETELNQVNDFLSTLQVSLKEDKTKLDSLETALETLQQDIKKYSAKTTLINQEIATLKQELSVLQKQEKRLRTQVSKHQASLAQNLQALYMPQSNSEIKLLLNQKNAVQLRRSLSLYSYLQNAQRESIISATAALEHISEVEEQAKQKQLVLQYKQQQLSKLTPVLTEEQQQRIALIDKLKTSISNKSLSNRALHQREYDLKSMLNLLGEKQIAEYKPDPLYESILTYKGNLAWPIETAYSAEKTISLTKNRGLLIKVAPNTPVKAIYSGEVVFADWLKGYGLLIIVDHGEEFMSLYAYNNRLLKHPGERVLQGEPIAIVGDAEQNTSEVDLYFELRRHGEPVNPNQWLAERR